MDRSTPVKDPPRDPRASPVLRAVALCALVIAVQAIALFIGDGSAAVVSDLLHNLAEAPAHVVLVAAYVPRRRHPEASAERVVQGTMIAAGLMAIWQSVTTLRDGDASGGIPLLVAAVASFAGARYAGTILHRAWQKHGGATLRRASLYLRLDAWGILAVIGGVLAAGAGLWFADPLAGFVVAGLMLWGALHHHDEQRDGVAVTEPAAAVPVAAGRPDPLAPEVRLAADGRVAVVESGAFGIVVGYWRAPVVVNVDADYGTIAICQIREGCVDLDAIRNVLGWDGSPLSIEGTAGTAELGRLVDLVEAHLI